MKKINEIILKLINEATPFEKIEKFSDSPGIYAFFFYGENFPLPGYKPKVGEIIYIGKTESSQKKRDVDTHFATGKTGSSTVRKSFGSLLREKLSLNPIPRGQKDIDAGRTSAFKFDKESEVKLTEWMTENLGLSFQEYKGDIKLLEKLETDLIHEVVPVINIDKNPDNPYLFDLRRARKAAATIAYKGINLGVAKNIETINMDEEEIQLKSIHKYEDIWKMTLPQIKQALSNPLPAEIQLKESYFKKVGKRGSYSFNLEFGDGRVTNGISGTAVARDLARIMLADLETKALLKSKHIKIRMDKYYTVFVTEK